MKVIRLNDMEKVVTSKAVQVRHVINQPEVAVVNVVLQPGEVLPLHSTPVDVFFYVHSGHGAIIIDEEREIVKQGEIVLSPKDIPHGLIASEDSEFSVLVVKTPKP
ncbi:MAG: cupin domain-containing protein [Halanaerobiales bacterium]|nr:cupin domain-containing protein [Halanaerobiales bacterium]